MTNNEDNFDMSKEELKKALNNLFTASSNVSKSSMNKLKDMVSKGREEYESGKKAHIGVVDNLDDLFLKLYQGIKNNNPAILDDPDLQDMLTNVKHTLFNPDSFDDNTEISIDTGSDKYGRMIGSPESIGASLSLLIYLFADGANDEGTSDEQKAAILRMLDALHDLVVLAMLSIQKDLYVDENSDDGDDNEDDEDFDEEVPYEVFAEALTDFLNTAHKKSGVKSKSYIDANMDRFLHGEMSDEEQDDFIDRFYGHKSDDKDSDKDNDNK